MSEQPRRAPPPALTGRERRALRARAHALKVIVTVGGQGLTDAVLRELDGALEHHELVKTRLGSPDRAEREAWATLICERLGADRVQAIGKVATFFRPATPDGNAERREK